MQTPTPETDPSGLYGTVVGVLGAALALLTAFGVPLTQGQEEAILRLVVVAGPLVTAWLIRRKAWAPESVDAVVGDAYARGATGHALPAPQTILEESDR